MSQQTIQSGDPSALSLLTARLYWKPTGASTLVNLGNVVQHKDALKVGRFEHFASDNGLKRMDLSLVTDVNLTYELTLEENSETARQLLLLANVGTVVDAAIDFEQDLGAVTAASAGKVFSLTTPDDAGQPNIKAIDVKNGVLTLDSTPLVEGTDYTFDGPNGLVTLSSTFSSSGALAFSGTYNDGNGQEHYDAIANLLTKGSFYLYQNDQFDPPFRSEHTFTGQCWVSDWGTNDVKKTNEWVLMVRADKPVLIKTRGSSFTAPTDVPDNYPGLILWLRPDDFTLNDDDSVPFWNDASGNNEVLQSDGSKKPTFKSNIFPPYSGVRFDGSSDLMTIATPIDLPDDFTIICVAAVSGDSMLLGNSSLNRQIRIKRAGVNINSSYDGDTEAESLALTQPASAIRMLTWRRAGGFTSFYEGDAVNDSSSNAPLEMIFNQLGHSSTPGYFTGDLAEILVFDNDIGETAITNLYTKYFKSRYSTLT